MSFALSLFGNVIFTPLLEIMFSIFYCDSNQVSIYSKNIKCWEGGYTVHVIFSILSSCIIVFFSLFYIWICFDIRKQSVSNNSKKKTFPDVWLIVVKVYLSMVTMLFQGEENLYLITLTFIIVSLLAYQYWFVQPYYSKVLTKLYYISTFILFWEMLLLLIGALCIDKQFNGGIPLLIIGVVVVVARIVLFDEKERVLPVINPHSGEEYRAMLYELEEVFDNSQHQRKYSLILFGYIKHYEEHCYSSNCNLKEYMRKQEKVFLYLHLEELFQKGMTLFPDCISLQLDYVVLLIDKLFKLRKARGVLDRINEAPNKSLNDSFVILYLSKVIEMGLQEGSKKNSNESDVVMMRYKSLSISFKALIIKAASHYLEFWSLLMITRNEFKDDLTKLNDLGSKLNAFIEEIFEKLDMLQKIRKYDEEIIRLYSEFLLSILNNKKLSLEYYQKLNEVKEEGDDTEVDLFDEKELSEETFNSLIAKREEMYIILSTQSESFGYIINLSLGLASKLGYHKEEILGHHFDILLPEIYYKYENHLLKYVFNSLKDTQSKTIQDDKTIIQSKKKIDFFALTKAKYVIPLQLNVFLLQNENGKNFLIANTEIKATLFSEMDHQHQGVGKEEGCFVLTDSFLRITNFSSNAIRILGLSSFEINGNYDITNSIKEFNEHYLKSIIHHSHNEDHNFNHNDVKISLLKTFFSKPVYITWKHFILQASQSNLHSGQRLLNSKNDSDISQTRRHEQSFVVKLIEQDIGRNCVGFAFEFYSPENKPITNSTFVYHPMNRQSEYSIKIARKNSMNHLGFVNKKKTMKSEIAESTLIVEDSDNTDNADDFLKKKTMSTVDKKTMSFGQKIQFNKAFLPFNTMKFVLDPNKNVFKQFKINDHQLNIKEILFDKVKSQLNRIEEPILSSNESEGSSEGSDEDYSFSRTSSLLSEHQRQLEASSANITKEKNINQDYHNDYYHVDFNCIKLSIYDFKKKMPIEVERSPGAPYKSEIEHKISSDDNLLDSDSLIKPSYILNQSSSASSPHNYKSKKRGGGKKLLPSSNSLLFLSQLNSDSIAHKRKVLMRQLEMALKKQDTHLSIILFQIISLISLLLFIIFGAILLSELLSHENSLTQILFLFVTSSDMIIDVIMASYHVRELSLLNNPDYSHFYQERGAYIANHTNSLNELFTHYTKLQSSLSTSSITLSDPHYMLLYNETLTLKSVTVDLDPYFFNATIYSSFVLMQLCMHKLHLTNFDLFLPSNKDVYFFVYNTNNVNVKNHGNQTQIFVDQIISSTKDQMIVLLLFAIVFFFFHVVLFIGMKTTYERVTQKKICYLEVFLQINKNVIASLYEKCDKFLTKMQLECSQHHSKATQNDISSELSDEDAIQTNALMQIDLGSIQTSETPLHGNKNKKKGSKITSETKLLNSIFAFIFIASFAVILVNIVFYYYYMSNITTLTGLYQTQLSIRIMSLMAFNILREYIFDYNTHVFQTPVTNYINYLLKEYYSLIKNLQNEFEDGTSILAPQFSSEYYTLQSHNACYLGGDFFNTYYANTNTTCDTLTNQAVSYGLKSALLSFFEEIRSIKNYNDLLLHGFNSFNFKYNFTFVGTPYDDDYLPTDKNQQRIYISMMPVNVFNTANHLTASFLFRFILHPGFKEIMNMLNVSIQLESDYIKSTLTIGMSFYLCAATLSYFVIWKPFEVKLNIIMHKTKRMLCIIPREVLISIQNINVLLELDSSALNSHVE